MPEIKDVDARDKPGHDDNKQARPYNNDCNQRNKSAKPQWPLERSIPEFPTKVGGHHVTKSTDLARDSSLKDR